MHRGIIGKKCPSIWIWITKVQQFLEKSYLGNVSFSVHHVRQLMMPICPMALNSTTSSSTTFGAFRIITLNVEEWATAWKVLILLEAAMEEEKRPEEKRILVCWNM
nr:putative uncharacterized protein C21orf62-AS1 [Pongo abelii]